jgi:small ligand-binding sensory domain FIST
VATYGAALSEHPLATQAVGETVGQLLETVGTAPDLAALFVTGPHTGALEDIVRAVRQLLNPRVLIGATAVSVLGGGREVEEVGGVSLWAARFGVDLEPVRLEAFRSPDDEILVAGGGVLGRDEGTLLLLADPFSFPAEEVLEHLGEAARGVQIVGGYASAARHRGGNVILLDEERFRDGAAGVWLPPQVPVEAVVSQGCRPIGHPFTVTRSERNVIYELGGQPALDRLMDQIEELRPGDRLLAQQGLHVGVVMDEHRADFGRGDFLIRGVLGADRSAGAVAIGQSVEVGTTVQFQVRDATTATEDLQAMLLGRSADAALVFTCNGRGSRLFGSPDHDAAMVSEHLGSTSVGGMFCAGEFGPVGGRNFVHGFTASLALFGGAPAADGGDAEGASG